MVVATIMPDVVRGPGRIHGHAAHWIERARRRGTPIVRAVILAAWIVIVIVRVAAVAVFHDLFPGDSLQ
jgi:hypothetical protein